MTILRRRPRAGKAALPLFAWAEAQAMARHPLSYSARKIRERTGLSPAVAALVARLHHGDLT
jgi:hypothetical protein